MNFQVHPKKFEKNMRSVCQEYFSGNDRIYLAELTLKNIKQNSAIFYTFDETEGINDENLGHEASSCNKKWLDQTKNS